MSGPAAEQNDPNPPRYAIFLVGRSHRLIVRKAADPQHVCSVHSRGMKEGDSPFSTGS
jgi:hypothetical protein